MKKEKKGKKGLAIVLIIVAILAALIIAAGAVGGVLAVFGVLNLDNLLGMFGFGAREPEQPDAPEKVMSDLYWNVDRKEMIDPETGLSIREAAADGMYYLRLAVNGEQKEIPVADKKLVNRMDILDVFGLQFDAEGNVVDLISPEDMYVKIGEKVFVQSIEGNTMIVNTSQALNGMQIPVTLTGNEGVFSVSTLDKPAFDGEATELKIMDQVLIYGSDESTAHTIYVTDRFWESDVYWRTVRMYDSTNKNTSREQQPDGYWYFDMAAKGQIKTYRTNHPDVIKAIDGYSIMAACCGLVFDENGDVIDCFNAAMAARGYAAASGYHITELAEDGKSFTATRVMSGNEVGKTYSSVITEDTQIYNVTTTADYIGQPTELQMNDCCYIIADTKGNAKYIFVIIRQVDSPMYYLLNRSFSSASGMTAKPDADGYYNFTFAVKGKQKKFKTKDKELAEQIHSYGMNMMGLKVSGDKVLKAYNPECVSGAYSFAGGYFVQSFADPLVSAQSTGGASANGVLAEGAEIYDVSGVDRVKGKKATLREGDRIYCYTNAQGEITHIFITARYVAGTQIYWNINSRSYNGDTFETKATPDADGNYTFKVIKPGKGEVELKTSSKEVASQFHACATSAPIALKVSGTTLKAAYPGWACVEGGGYYSLANTTLTEKTEDGGYKALTTTYIYGTLRLGADCKTYNVGTMNTVKKFRGESASVQVGDRVYPLYSYQGAAKYIFITVREQSSAKVYWKADRKYNATTQETTRTPDADGYYVYKVTVDGKVQTVKTKDKQLASYFDSSALSVAAKVSGGIIKAVYPAEAANEIYAGQVSYRDVTKISGNNITTKRNKPGQTDTGDETEIEKASNCLIVNVSPTAGDNWGKKATLSRGDRVYTYKDNFGKTSIIYIVNECTRADGGYAKCPECGKTVWWEPATAGFSLAGKDYIPDTMHYYLEDDRERDSNVNFSSNYFGQAGKTTKIVLDLYGHTWTRKGTESFDAETGTSLGFRASSQMFAVGSGNTLTIINSTKKMGGLKAGEGVQFYSSGILLSTGSDTAKKTDNASTPDVDEEAQQLESLGYDTANFNEAGTLIIKAGLFDASKAVSTYTGANSGAISNGGNVIIKGGEIIGIKSSSTNITANAAAIGTWGGSSVTIEGGIVRGCPVDEGDVAGPGGAAISANSSKGVIKITGGEIIGSRTSGAEGSAIYNGNAEMFISGGIIRGGVLSNAAAPVVVSGKPVITNEYNGGLSPVNKVTVGELKEGASIYLNTTGIFTTDFETEAAAEAVKTAGYFKSETPIIRMEKALGTGEYRCLYGHTTKEQCQAASCEEELAFWKAWTNSEALPASGNYYLTTDVTVGASTTASNLVLDLNGHTITRDVFEKTNATTGAKTAAANVFTHGTSLLRLCDSSATPGKIVAVPNGFDGTITDSMGMIGSSSPNKDTGARATLKLDRITVDGSALHTTYASANTGIVVAGGDAYITDATVMGYTTNVNGCGTAIGSWGGSTVTIGGNSTIIGGNADSATSGKGQGGVIAVNGDLTINDGIFKTYEGTAASKHGGIICMNNGQLVVNGGTFYGNTCTSNGGVINGSSRPVTINGGTFYAAKSNGGGVLYGSGKTVITGGTFIGTGSDSNNVSKSGGLVYNNGAELTITGGTFKNGNDSNGGCNIYFAGAGTLTIAGNADIAGEVLIYGKDDANHGKLVVGGKAIVDYTKADFSKSRNIRLKFADAYLNNTDGEALVINGTTTTTYSLTYNCAGEVNGIITGTAPAYEDHDFDDLGKCTKCGAQAEGETRCVNGHKTADECAAAGCTAEIKFFRAWEETTSLPTSGAWFLADNVTVAKSTAVSGELALDLNGKTITRTAAKDNIEVYSVGHNKLYLGDSAEVAGSIVVNVDGIEGGIIKSTTGVLTNSSRTDTQAGAITIDRITVDASAVQDNLYVGLWKTAESHLTSTEKTTAVPLTDADGNTLVYLTKEGGVPIVRTAINAGAIVVGSDLTINGATIKGYQHTQGNGTAIGTWGGGAVTINKDSVIIGGVANNIGSKALFGTENDFGAISNLGQGGVIAMGAASLTINGGEFKTYEGAEGTKHGGLIMMNGGSDARSILTITDGTFYGPTTGTRGAVIHGSSSPVTISGGTFYAGTANEGGILAGAGTTVISGGTFGAAEGTAPYAKANGGLIYYYGKTLTISGGTFNAIKATEKGGILALNSASYAATITGGTFNGVGNVDALKSNFGGLIYNLGTLTISGGTFQNGLDVQGGRNLYNEGTMIINGNAVIAGEVLSYAKSGTAKLTVGGKAVIDSTLSAEGLNRSFNIRARNCEVFVNDGTTAVKTIGNTTTKLNLVKDADGNVTGVE